MGTIDDPRIGIAFGGGSARGLAHIPFIEAMDEMGVVPTVIAGTSIGSLIGSGWAAGMTGEQLRAHAHQVLGNVNSMFGRLWTTHVRGLGQLMRDGISLQLDAERVVDAFVPSDFPVNFEDLRIPFYSVATDFRSWHQVVFHEGPLKPAIAGSIAIPSLFKSVAFRGTLFVDGGVVNPMPLDVAAPDTDILIGIDVNGDPMDWDPLYIPSALDIGLGSAQIMMHQLIAHMIAAYPPDLYFRPHLNSFGFHEYWRVREIIAAGAAEKERFKRELSGKIEGFIAGQKRSV